MGAVFGLVPPPVATEAGQAEAVSTWNGHWVGEDVLTQRAQEVLLREKTDGGGHFLKMKVKRHLICFPSFLRRAAATMVKLLAKISG